jgi:uncharacterized protein
MMKQSLNLRSLVSSKREEIQALARDHGVKRVRVFGSVARGEAGPLSDIDFLVEMEPNRGLLDQAGFMLALRALLDTEVDVVSERGIKPRYRDRVLQEAVSL